MESGLLLLNKYKKAVDDEGVPGFYVRALARFVDGVSAVSDLAKRDKVFASVLPKDVAKQMVTVARYAQKSVVENALVGPLLAEYRKDPTNEVCLILGRCFFFFMVCLFVSAGLILLPRTPKPTTKNRMSKRKRLALDPSEELVSFG